MIWNVLDVETAFIQAILQYKSLIICKTNSSCNSFLVETKFYLLKYELGCEIMKAVASKLFPEKKKSIQKLLEHLQNLEQSI
jgi:hypothetical protein